MKLKTILEAFGSRVTPTRSSDKQQSTMMDRISASKNYEFVGSGHFAKVGNQRTKPHEVFKVGTTHNDAPLEDDGYFNYAKMIANSEKAQQNPYFPRIYSVKSFMHTYDKPSYHVRMERLQPLSELPLEVLESMMKRMFHPQALQADGLTSEQRRIRHNLEKGTNPDELEEINRENLYDHMSLLLARVVTEPAQMALIKDPMLKQAMMFIRTLHQKGVGDIDIHEENLMFRPTPHGPQLVITDPLMPYNYYNNRKQNDG